MAPAGATRIGITPAGTPLPGAIKFGTAAIVAGEAVTETETDVIAAGAIADKKNIDLCRVSVLNTLPGSIFYERRLAGGVNCSKKAARAFL